MKKSVFLVALAFGLFASQAKAQVIQGNNYYKGDFGVKVGVNYQMMSGSPWVPKLNSGIVGGVYKDMMHGNSGFHIEVNFTEAHYTSVHPASYYPGYLVQPARPADWDLTQNADFELIYLQIPVLAQFKIYKALHFLIGPAYSQQLSIADNNGAFTKDYGSNGGLKSVFKTAELMGQVGLEAKMKQRINLGFRLGIGLTSVNKGAGSTTENNFRAYDGWKPWSMQMTFGFKLKSNY